MVQASRTLRGRQDVRLDRRLEAVDPCARLDLAHRIVERALVGHGGRKLVSIRCDDTLPPHAALPAELAA
jgi:hypothetical protein